MGAELELDLKIILDKVAARFEFGKLAAIMKEELRKETGIEFKTDFVFKLMKELEKERTKDLERELKQKQLFFLKYMKWKQMLEIAAENAEYARKRKADQETIAQGERAKKAILASAKQASVIPQIKAADMRPTPVMFEAVKAAKKTTEWMERPKDTNIYGNKVERQYDIDKQKIQPGQVGGKQPDTVAGSPVKTGIIAGVSAAITLELIDALKDAAKRSQILGGTFEIVGKLLGLMVDLILLPFLPIIAGALVWLVKVLVYVGSLWDKFIKWLFPEKKDDGTTEPGTVPNSIPTIGDTLKLFGIDLSKIDLGNDILNGILQSLGNIDWATALAGVAALIIAGLVAALLIGAGVSVGWALVAAAILGVLLVLLTTALVKAAQEAGWNFANELRAKFGDPMMYLEIAGVVAGGLIGAIIGGIAGIVGGPAGMALGATAGALLGGMIVKGLEDWAYQSGWNFAEWIRVSWNPAIEDLKWQLNNIGLLFTQIADSIWNALVGVYNRIASIPGAEALGIRKMEFGGIVPGMPGTPQLIIAHGQEEVIPYNQRGKGTKETKQEGNTTTTNNFNFYGYQDDKFVNKVKDVMRQQGAQYKL